MQLSSRQESSLLDCITEWVQGLDPEDLFDEDALEQWALDNGFVKEEAKEEPKSS